MVATGWDSGPEMTGYKKKHEGRVGGREMQEGRDMGTYVYV